MYYQAQLKQIANNKPPKAYVEKINCSKKSLWQLLLL